MFVAVPPDILDDESSSDTLATEGMRVLLNCRARGNPEPAISWVREDGKMLRICRHDGPGKGRKRKKGKKAVANQQRSDMQCKEGKNK